MVDIGITRKEDYIEFAPIAGTHLFDRGGQPVGQLMDWGSGMVLFGAVCLVWIHGKKFVVNVARLPVIDKSTVRIFERERLGLITLLVNVKVDDLFNVM